MAASSPLPIDLGRRAKDNEVRYLPTRAATPLIYVAAIALAELAFTRSSPVLGLLGHLVVLFCMIVHSSFGPAEDHALLLALVLAPLVRVVSLTLPFADLPLIYWYMLNSIPLFAAGIVAARVLGLTHNQLGLQIGHVQLQLLIGLLGLPLAGTLFVILRPGPLVTEFSWHAGWQPALILLICTGFLEEFLFRGVLQAAAKARLGNLGPIYVSAVAAALYVSYLSIFNVAVIFGIGLAFAWLVARTRSLLGVSLAHGLTNVGLFLVLPYVVLHGTFTTAAEAPGAESRSTSPAITTTLPETGFAAPVATMPVAATPSTAHATDTLAEQPEPRQAVIPPDQASVVVRVPATSAGPYCAPGAMPAFPDSMLALKDRLGDILGSPVECAHADPENGDILQVTTTGLAFVRAVPTENGARDAAFFTNGWEHWALMPWGLAYWTGEAVGPPHPYCIGGASPSFQGPLQTLRSRLGNVMGNPLECPHWSAHDGDMIQATSTGLAFVRKRNGVAYFTNGWEHWALGRRGVAYWTGDSEDPPRNATLLKRSSGPVRPR